MAEVQEIEVVLLRAIAPGAAWDACFGVLSDLEQERALRIRAGTARDEFVTARAALRVLLGERLGLKPAAVQVRTGEYGRPLVDGVSFSVTHARGLIGLAVCADGGVGLDLEWVDRSCETREIAESHFAPGEIAAMRSSADPAAYFFHLWTRKEAALKAVGVGLGVALDTFDVSARDGVFLLGRTLFLETLPVVECGWMGHAALVGRRPRLLVEEWSAAKLVERMFANKVLG